MEQICTVIFLVTGWMRRSLPLPTGAWALFSGIRLGGRAPLMDETGGSFRLFVRGELWRVVWFNH